MSKSLSECTAELAAILTEYRTKNQKLESLNTQITSDEEITMYLQAIQELDKEYGSILTKWIKGIPFRQFEVCLATLNRELRLTLQFLIREFPQAMITREYRDFFETLTITHIPESKD